MHNLTTLSVTPSTTAQSIEPESPVDGYSSVSVSAVTAAIDENIVAGNIKKDVQILGVTGSYEGNTVEFSATPASFTLLTNIHNLNAVIPVGVTTISTAAFNGCTGLTSVAIPVGVKTIENIAFNGCTGLVGVDIPNSVTTIGGSAFNGCTNLATITVNKAEGSIAGAPWGATNATVVWNG